MPSVNAFPETLRRLLPGVWFGLLLAIALIATPAASGALDRSSFGAVARAIFAREAPASIVLGVVLLMLERRAAFIRHESEGVSQFSLQMALVVVALFCTVMGYYALEPVMAQARLGGTSSLTFGQVHALSLGFFGAKGLVVLALAWQAAR